MTSDMANYYLVIIGGLTAGLTFLTLCVLFWYTCETRRMQKAVTKQSSEMVHQIQLMIMPALVAQWAVSAESGAIDGISLSNEGNGTALAVTVELIQPDSPVNPQTVISFQPIVSIRKGESWLATPLNKSELPTDREQTKTMTVELHIKFQDIEGNIYERRPRIIGGMPRPERIYLAASPNEKSALVKRKV